MSSALAEREAETELRFPPRPAPSIRALAATAIMVALFAASVWSVIELRINVASIVDSAENARRFVGRVFPLDFPPLAETLDLVAQTLAIVTLATLLAVVLSLPLALLAAWNTTLHPSLRPAARAVIVLMRALPDLVMAIIFFRLFGLGAVPGILAMGLHSIGMIGKLYADATESLDNGPKEAIRAAGGGRWQQITAGILPQLMPQIIATALHRFDINLRTSVILGYVGVGGIGLAMAEALRTLNYQRGMALAFIVLVLCIVVELISGSIRAALMRRSGATPGYVGTWVDRALARGGVDGASRPERLTPPWSHERIYRAGGILLLVGLVAASFAGSRIDPDRVWSGILAFPSTLGLFWPPGGMDILGDIASQMLVTIQIGLAATLLGAVLAIPIGIFAARNVVGNRAVTTAFRILIVTVRGIPELIIAIVFVVISGLGGVAGTLALAIGAVGLLSKLVADSLEETDERVQDALRAAGAGPVQVFFAATLRQALPAFVAHVMYLLDTNFRSATLLGIVGAGGIGFLLLNATRVLQFDVVTTILLFILATVLVVEALSLFVRRCVR